jgi:hypothetical protein
MSQAPSSGPGRLPLSGSRRVDEACDRFEAAWNVGAPPRLEDFLGPAMSERPVWPGKKRSGALNECWPSCARA